MVRQKRIQNVRHLLSIIQGDEGIPQHLALALFRFRFGVGRTTSYEYLEDLVDSQNVIVHQSGVKTLYTIEGWQRFLKYQRPEGQEALGV